LFPFLRYKMISGKNKMSRPREKCQPPGTWNNVHSLTVAQCNSTVWQFPKTRL
jgi:hypothetical protein